MSDPLDGTIAQAAEALRRRTISARELTEAALKRIEILDPALRLFVHVEPDFARAAAARADALLARGDAASPLCGIPIAHKDNIERRGQRATAGSRALRDRFATRTAAALRRLDRAGAVDLGGTSMSEFAFHVHGTNGLREPPANPWDRSRLAGASSGGSGAAVAARCVFAALGTDSGGSIRNPAAYCGVAGLLPTAGAIDRDGLMLTSETLDAIGPMARTARDCALLFETLAGRPGAAAAEAPRARRIRVLAHPHLAALPSPIAAAMQEAADRLAAEGVTVASTGFADLDAFNALAGIVFLHEAAAAHGGTLRRHWDLVHPAIRERLIGGYGIDAALHARALGARGRALRHFLDAVLGDADALLLPCVPAPPPRFAELDRPPEVDPGLFTRFANYLGVPALSVPAGRDAAGLPRAVQLVGRPQGEASLFALAAALEPAFPPLLPPG